MAIVVQSRRPYCGFAWPARPPGPAYDAMPQPGECCGMGYPSTGCPKILDKNRPYSPLGVNFVNSTRVGTDISLDYLRENYDAVFIAIGAWRSSQRRVEGKILPAFMEGLISREVALNGNVEIGRRLL